MKAKANIPKHQKPSRPTLPEHPVRSVNIINLPKISKGEIDGYVDALWHHQLAQADFERRHADLFYKLTLGCKVDPSSETKVSLDKDGHIIFTEECDVCLSKFDPRP